MRSTALDILRAIAVLLVMGAHIPDALYFQKTSLTPALTCWMRCGWTGVDLFFVLSGFLVSGLLFREYQNYQKIDLKKFFIRRGLKIYPAFYTFLILSTILLLLEGFPFPSIKRYLAEIFYIQNYFPHIWEHTWSLAIEEHFYFLIGFLVLYLSRTQHDGPDPFGRFIPISITCCIVILIIRTIHAHYYLPYTHRTHLFPTHLRLDSLLFGVFLSYFYHFRPGITRAWVEDHKRLLFITSLLLLSSAQCWSLFDPFMYTFGFTLLYLGYGGLLMLAVYCVDEKKIAKNKMVRVMAKIGIYSYSIYLWHIIFSRMVKYFNIPINDQYSLFAFVDLFIYIAGSIAVGMIMSLIIEMPLLHLRDRFFTSRSNL